MGKQLLILLGGIFCCIFLIEIILKIFNPFITSSNADNSSYWNSAPNYILEIKPEHFKKKNILFFLSTSSNDSLHNSLWIQKLMQDKSNENYVQLADITINDKFLNNITSLKDYLEKYTPNTLVLEIDPAIIIDFVDVPNYHFDNDNTNNLLYARNSEILHSFNALFSQTYDDTIVKFNASKTSIGYKDTSPVLDSKILSKATAMSDLLVRNIISLHHFCKKRGIRLIIVPSPILWRASDINDRYSRLPLNKITLTHETPTSWYAELYYLMLKRIEKKLPTSITWIELYKNFPSDSRFFHDGLRLNDSGQVFFSQMYIGRSQLIREYRELFN